MHNSSNSSSGVDSLAVEARSLVQRAFQSYNAQYGFSTTSCQVYDTAWVAMVTKRMDAKLQWRFPECFHYLLQSQSEDGGWGTHPASQTAGILDTAAALLALIRHAAEPLQIYDVSPSELQRRTGIASESLRNQLALWNDVLVTNHIGVEMIIPALLKYLQEEDYKLTFDFDSKDDLANMNEAKLSRFKPESLYGNVPSSALHSLEAFVGKIEFDKVAHHLFQGSMMASPSSTAAYLMQASHWDEKAESYLCHILTAGTGHGDGGIPGTFPTTNFEFSWLLTTLIRGGFTKSDLECPELHGITGILLQAFKDDGGIIGFAPRAVDVDDTAKGLLALSLVDLVQDVSPDPMIKVFEGHDHFRTFGSERDPSFTSNCHVLMSLLHEREVLQYGPQIRKTVTFLCNHWWGCDRRIKDKWHLSHLYPTMLMVEAFADVLCLLDNGTISGLLEPDVESKVSICLFQACSRTLSEQCEDGSWNSMPEQTSYAILLLAEARRIYYFADILSPLESAIARGIKFLQSYGFRSPDLNWTSKTAYRTAIVAEAYLLAAFKASQNSASDIAVVGSSLGLVLSRATTDAYMRLVRETSLFSSLPEWHVRTSLIESTLFIPLLRATRLEVYERDDMPVAKDSYLDIIPFTWVGCNNRSGIFAPTSLIFDMMKISLLGYQTDEFFEASAAPEFDGQLATLHKLIDDTIATIADREPTAGKTQKLRTRHEAARPLARFVQYVLKHHAVRRASAGDQANLENELSAFLHAHATQAEDNARILNARRHTEREQSNVVIAPTRSFFHWVRSTGADHVACAYSFAFACCLISTSLDAGRDLFPTVKEKYLIASATRHLATMCRMCNDVGSVARDTAEGNLNSVHFPEFEECCLMEHKRQVLIELARYEHGFLDHNLALLEHEALASRPRQSARNIVKRKMELVKFYCDVTDFYDQLYLLRDLSSSMK